MDARKEGDGKEADSCVPSDVTRQGDVLCDGVKMNGVIIRMF